MSFSQLPGSSAPRHILITGGCGFIGANLIAHLLNEDSDTKIRVLDNLSVGTKEDLSGVCDYIEFNPSVPAPVASKQVELFIGDIRDLDTCIKSCEDVDVVIHLAANTGVAPSVVDPALDMESNVIGTFNLLEASRKNNIDRFVFASSGAPIGETEPPIHEEKAPRPVSPYGASKLAGEGYCSAYYRTFGIKTVSLRFGNVYGPRSKHKSSVVAKFIKQALDGETLEIYGDGNQTRDFIYIDDLIQAIMLSLNTEVGGEIFQIATHKETTINELAEKIKVVVENETGQKFDVIYSKPRLGDIRRNYSDISKARKIIGFDPKYDLAAGLKETFKYFISSNK